MTSIDTLRAKDLQSALSLGPSTADAAADHPDDAEIAMGMRIRWYTENGAHVRVHCLTTGSPAPNGSDVRRQECLAAGAVLGVESYTFSEIPGTRLTDHRGDINAELFRVLGCGRPDIVYTHYPTDQHLDHTATAHDVTAVALREAANLTYSQRRRPPSGASPPSSSST